MMKSIFIFIISLIITVKFKDNSISLFTGVISFFAFIYFLFEFLGNLNNNDTAHKEKLEPKKKTSKRKLTKYELELFAKQCNSYLEYEDKKELWNSGKDEI